LPIKDEPLVSVVTPVYNGARYIRQCIESVQAQTYGNWDHTIVDNASTDRTAEIAREYAAGDSRIRVRSNISTVPVIQNYNIAFRAASPQSRYCKPVAADDVLLPECLEKMVALAERHPGVAMVGSYGIYSRAELGTYGRGIPYTQEIFPGPELCRRYLLGEGPVTFGAATMLLFRADLVRGRHAFYNEEQLHADSEACLEVLEQGDFGFVHQVLTIIRIEDGTLSSRSARLNTSLPFRLYLLGRYGAKYFSPDELATCARERLREYYRYLGWQVFRAREPEFWKFHRDQLAAAGYPLSRMRLGLHATEYVLDQVLNPKRTVERLVAHLRDRPPGRG